LDDLGSTLTRHRLPRAAAWIGAAAALAFAMGSGPASAALSGGAWSQAQGDAGKTGVASSGPSSPFKTAWTAKGTLGGPDQRYGYAPPALSGEEAVAVGPTQVVGYRLSTGSQAFAVDRDYGPSVSAAIADLGAGLQAVVYTEGFGDNPPTASGTPRPTPSSASPTPSGAGSTAPASPVDSHVAAFDLATQKPLWPAIQLAQVSRTGVTVSGTTAYVGDIAGNVYAIDLTKGTILWKVDVGGTLVTSVATSGDRVIVCSQGSRTGRSAVLGLDVSDGSSVWRNDAPSLGLIMSSPSIGGGATYVGYSDATLHAFDLESGEERWSARLSAPLTVTTGPAVTEDAVYAVDLYGELYRFDPASGARAWEFALNEGVYRSGPVIVGDTALVATVRGRLASIDTSTGHLVAEIGGSGAPLRGLAVAPDLVVGVRAGTHAGLVAFEHDPSGVSIDVVSPTVVDPTRLGVNFAVAAVAFVLLLLVAGRLVAPKMGPAFIYEDGPDTEPTVTGVSDGEDA
jgi:outer membrane protein assembly factor BamB